MMEGEGRYLFRLNITIHYQKKKAEKKLVCDYLVCVVGSEACVNKPSTVGFFNNRTIL